MAALPTSNNHISIHLSDRALTPLVSSSQPRQAADTATTPQSQAQSQALSSLTTTAITAYDSASRLGLGLPQRIIIETRSGGPVILHSFLNPQSSAPPASWRAGSPENGRGIVEQAREDLRPLSGSEAGDSEEVGDGGALVNGVECGKDMPVEEDGAAENVVQQPPLLIASVVTPSAGEAGEARRAAARLERIGKEFQREWVREQEEGLEPATVEEDG